MRLFHYWRSSSSWRVRWALEIKGVKVDLTAVNLLADEQRSDAHKARNPWGAVPVLEIQPGKFLGESAAILEWLEEQYPMPALLPGDPWLRARSRQLFQIINAGTQPIQNLEVLTAVAGDDQDKRAAWARRWMEKGLSAFEVIVRETAGRHCVGDQITMADLALIPQAYNAGRFGLSLDAYPTVQRVVAAGLATPSCKAAHPDHFQPS